MNRRTFVRWLGASAMFSSVSPALATESEIPVETLGPKADAPTSSRSVWHRAVIVPVPVRTAGVEKTVLSLNGPWKFTFDPQPGFWSNQVSPATWKDITVPGECVMQGFRIARDTEYPYKKLVRIPPDFRDKRIFLRFDGLYSYGRVWVNGHFVRDHNGGFTSWDCDITSHVTPGEEAWITVGVTDRSDDVSWGSNYAKHYIGGILQDVRLVAVPKDYVTRFHVETDFDSSYTDAMLRVTVAMSFDNAREATVAFRLRDPDGRQVLLHSDSLRLSPKAVQSVFVVSVPGAQKWDCEHPRLYELEADVRIDGSSAETFSKKVGFRKIEIRGNQMLINGDPIKLRGGCRHDVHPTLGRAVTPELDEQDVRLLKDANYNFVRTSHYPPTQSFLEFCDQYGIYIEEEAAVCFVGHTYAYGSNSTTQNDPDYTARYMNQFAEMIERDQDHPSVIFWSLGNENKWGDNFAKEHDYAKHWDPARPLIFSYANSVPKGVEAYDIYSDHYPKFDSDFSSPKIPKLNDEYGHVACYNKPTLQRDPGVRVFWGKSLKEFSKGMEAADGCLGGAIWASIDEVFMTPEVCIGFGEWGILDGWRREKPEYWLTRKAYSPMKIPDQDLSNPGLGKPLEIPIRNEFNHTNLRESRITWQVGTERGEIEGPNLAPHREGILSIPPRRWKNGDIVQIKFFGPDNRLVDEYAPQIGKSVLSFPPVQGPAPQVTDTRESVEIHGSNFAVYFSKVTGLVSKATYNKQVLLVGGPCLNLPPVQLAFWRLTEFGFSTSASEAIVKISGNYQQVGRRFFEILVFAEFEIRIDGKGLMTTHYKIHKVPQVVDEVGVAYILPRAVGQLTWNRKSIWSIYPNDHIGRKAGNALKLRRYGKEEYRAEPQWPWSEDMKDFFLFGKEDLGGRGTNDFRSQKEHIWFASCVVGGSGMRVRAESDGSHAARAEILKDGRVQLNINNLWSYHTLDWGNDAPSLKVPSDYENSIKLRLTDNDSVACDLTPQSGRDAELRRAGEPSSGDALRGMRMRPEPATTRF